MRFILGCILSPCYYFLMGFFLLIFHPIQYLCSKLFGYNAHKKSVDVLNFFLTYATLFLFNIPVFKNKYSLPQDRPIIFVSNHQSFLDIPGLIFFLRKHHGKFISKIELLKARIPSISYNLKHGGGANIERKDTEQSKAAILSLANRMKKNNWSAFIFPEGTRSKSGKVSPFHVGGIATLLSVVPDALIVPICIKGSYKTVQQGQFPLMPFNVIKWEILKPLSAGNKPLKNLILDAEMAIRQKIEEQA